MAKLKIKGILKGATASLAMLGGCDEVLHKDYSQRDYFEQAAEEREAPRAQTPNTYEQVIFVDETPVQQPRTPAPQPQPIQQARPNYRTTNFANDSDEVLLARMLFGEARNCSDSEKAAIGYVALNRVQRGRYGNGLRGVILRRNQFSCFNANDPNRERLMDPMRYEHAAFENCLGIARGVLSGNETDNTQGATHYFNPNSASPSWADSMARIGRIDRSRHEFYRE